MFLPTPTTHGKTLNRTLELKPLFVFLPQIRATKGSHSIFFMWILRTMSGLEELRKKLAPLFDAEKGFSSSSTLDPCDSYTVILSPHYCPVFVLNFIEMGINDFVKFWFFFVIVFLGFGWLVQLRSFRMVELWTCWVDHMGCTISTSLGCRSAHHRGLWMKLITVRKRTNVLPKKWEFLEQLVVVPVVLCREPCIYQHIGFWLWRRSISLRR